MIDYKSVLVAIDCDYLYGGARAEYGNWCRIAYRKLQMHIEHMRPDATFHFHAFIAIKSAPRTNAQLALVGLLNRWGFVLHTGTLAYDDYTGEKKRDNLTQMIITFVREFRCGLKQDAFPGTVVLVSGSGALADLCLALTTQQVQVDVMTYGDISQQLLLAVNHVPLPTDLVYMVQPPQPG